MKTPVGYFHDGMDAAEAGLGEEACPLVYDAWPRHAWLEGHRFSRTFSPVNLRVREQEPLERVNKTPETQGGIAFSKGLGIDAVPYEPESQDWRRWRLGWIDAFNNRQEDEADFKVDFKARAIAFVVYALAIVLTVGAILWAKYG